MSYMLFALLLFLISLYTWGYVDTNAPFAHIEFLRTVVYEHRIISSISYISIIILLFGWYGYLLFLAVKDRISLRQVLYYLVMLISILFISYPAFSNDIFNYIATARVTYLYHENPYVVMPIDISNESMLTFLHAANKTALYGPAWILLSFLPHTLGFNNIFFTLYAFKLFAILFYCMLVCIVWKLTKRISAVVFIAFNPLVIIDTLISAHNDVVMMVFALSAFYLLQQKKYILSGVFLFASILIKGATLFLIPVYCYTLWSQLNKKDWEHIWEIALYSMFFIFCLSPFREEMYSWYFIWVLTFVSLRKKKDLITALSIGFSVGLLLRFLPFVYFRDWGGVTPVIKIIVTIVPILFAGIVYAIQKKH